MANIEPQEVVEFRRLEESLQRGEVTQRECERYFELAIILVSNLGPHSYPENVGVFPDRVADHSRMYPEAARVATRHCIEIGLPASCA